MNSSIMLAIIVDASSVTATRSAVSNQQRSRFSSSSCVTPRLPQDTITASMAHGIVGKCIRYIVLTCNECGSPLTEHLVVHLTTHSTAQVQLVLLNHDVYEEQPESCEAVQSSALNLRGYSSAFPYTDQGHKALVPFVNPLCLLSMLVCEE